MTLLSRRTLFAALVLCACHGDKKRNFVLAFQRDPEGVLQEVAALEDPVHQEAIILRLSEAYPGRVGSMCSSLQNRNVRKRCERLGSRPHLAAAVNKGGPAHAPVLARAGAGPPTGSLPFPDAMRQHWDTVAPEPGDCVRNRAKYHLCLAEQAAEAAQAGDTRAAAAACNAARTDRMRCDCFFGTAEDTPLTAKGYHNAASLCLGSGTFVHECNGHLFAKMAPAELGHERTAAVLVTDARTVAEAWQEIAPDLEPLMLDLYWARAAERLIPIVGSTEPSLFETLPAEAWPHIRSAMAWGLARCEDPLVSLQWAANPERRPSRPCTARPDSPGDAARSKGTGGGPEADLLEEQLRWTRDLEGEDRFPAVYFLVQGAGRRATDPDADVDLLLAGLSVQAHREHAHLDLFASYAEDERLVVRWTAVRLLAALAPNHPALALAAEDPDPSVRQRAKLSQRTAAASGSVSHPPAAQ